MLTRTFRAHALILASALSFAAPLSWAAQLDPAFGTGGVALPTFPNTLFGQINDLAAQPDGSLVGVVNRATALGNEWSVVRLTPAGLPDATFGNGGLVTTPFPGNFNSATSVAVVEGGKILVSGLVNTPQYDFALARYLPNGDLDPLFGTAGIVVTDFGGQDLPFRMTRQPDGKIVVVGMTGNHFAIARYSANGVVDPDFGTGGKVVVTMGGIFNEASAVEVLADGNIVVAGVATPGGNGDIGVLRLLPNGVLDPNFSDDGKAVAGCSEAIAYVGGIAMRPGGGIIVGGTSLYSGEIQFAYFHPNGVLDNTFAPSGVVVKDLGFSGTSGRPRMIPQGPNHFLFAAGLLAANGAYRPSISRFNLGAELDYTFFGTGHTEELLSPSLSPGGTFSAVAVDASQRIVLGGVAAAGENSVPLLARLDEDADAIQRGAAIAYRKGGLVPFAGRGLGVPLGAIWTGFGSPAVGELGELAFAGKWTSKDAKRSGTSIFLNGRPVVSTGQEATDSTVPGAVFKAFKDPVIDYDGNFACLATLTGVGITSANDTVVVLGDADSCHVVAQEGGPVVGATDAAFRAFSSVSIQNGQAIFQASLLIGTGGITAQNDTGVWTTNRHAKNSVLREGSVVEALDGGVVKSFTCLKATTGSPGQGRAQLDDGRAVIQVTMMDGKQGVIVTDGNLPTVLAAPGQETSHDPMRKLAKINQPSGGSPGVAIFALGKLAVSSQVPAAQTTAIFFLAGGESLAAVQTLMTTPIGDGSVYTSFRDPVGSPNQFALSLLCNIKGGSATTATDQCLFWFSPTGAQLAAREGGVVPGAPEAKFKAISSVAMIGVGYGPLFTATLQKGLGTLPGPGGITSINDLGLYYTDASGVTHQVVRENQPLCGKVVKTFAVLKATAGTAGATRNYNYLGRVVLNVIFTDKTTGIVTIDLPSNAMPH